LELPTSFFSKKFTFSRKEIDLAGFMELVFSHSIGDNGRFQQIESLWETMKKDKSSELFVIPLNTARVP
jgi:hypothetical protein